MEQISHVSKSTKIPPPVFGENKGKVDAFVREENSYPMDLPISTSTDHRTIFFKVVDMTTTSARGGGDEESSSGVLAECCLFCCKIYRSSRNSEKTWRSGGGEHRILKLVRNLRRSTNGNGRDPGVDLEELTRSVLGDPEGAAGGVPFQSCEECWKMMSTFCDAIHRMRVAELEAEWRLRQLVELMRSAERVPGRKVNFNVFLQAYRETYLVSCGAPEAIQELRTMILKTCLKKLEETASPKVVLKRCQIPKIEKIRRCHQDDPKEEGPASTLSDNEDDVASLISNEDEALTPEVNSTVEEPFPKATGEVGGNRMERKRRISLNPHSPNNSTVTNQTVKRRKDCPGNIQQIQIKVTVKQEVNEEDEATDMYPLSPSEASSSDLSNSDQDKQIRPKKGGSSERKTVGVQPQIQCDICLRVLASTGARSNHMKAFHTSSRFLCKHCPQKFKLKHALTAHVFTKHRALLLNEFRVEGTSPADFEVEIDAILETLTKNNGRKCDLCFKKFTTTWWCAMHIIREHRERLTVAFQGGDPRDPSIIEEPRKKPALYLKRAKMSSGGPAGSQDGRDVNQCDYCSQKFSCNSNRTKHALTHHPAEVLSNYHLKEKTSEADFLKGIRHVFKKLMGGKKKQFQCRLCNKHLRSLIVCQQHIVREHEDRFGQDLLSYQENILKRTQSSSQSKTRGAEDKEGGPRTTSK